MITVITGAGISATAGIPTYRAQNSLWKEKDFEQRSHVKNYGNHLDYLKPRWVELAETMRQSSPTLFHEFVAEQGWNVITQNIDGLHQKAGSENVIEIHGTIFQWKQIKNRDNTTFSFDNVQQEREKVFAELLSKNDEMIRSERIRPDIVLFGEQLKKAEEALSWVKWSDQVIYAGTSGSVFPVSDWYVQAQGETILIDPKPWGNFDKTFAMTTDEWAEANRR